MVETKMGSHSTAYGIFTALILIQQFFQVAGCGEGYLRTITDINGKMTPICCQYVSCKPETQVRKCTIDGGFDTCEPCPSGTTLLQATDSRDPIKCYESPCSEEGEKGPTGECECKAGYCGKYPDCLKSHCPSQDTTVPIPTSAITTTSTIKPTTVSMIMPLAEENSTFPGFRTGTTPITKIKDQTTSPPSSDDPGVPVIAIVLGIFAPVVAVILIGLLVIRWFHRRRQNGRANHDTEAGSGYTPLPNGLLEDNREQDTTREANGRNLHTTMPRAQGELNQNGGTVQYHVHGNGNVLQFANGPGGQNHIHHNEDHHHTTQMDAPEMPPADQNPGQATTPPAQPQHDQGPEASDPVEERRTGIQEEGQPEIRQDPHPSHLGSENFISV